jgi:hypothetical protein
MRCADEASGDKRRTREAVFERLVDINCGEVIYARFELVGSGQFGSKTVLPAALPA